MDEALKHDGLPPRLTESSRASSGEDRSSLRAELLFNLGFLALAALILAVSSSVMLTTSGISGTRWKTLLFLLVLVDVGVFVVLGGYLIQRLVVGPLQAVAEGAHAIAAGDTERRIPVGETREIAVLAEAVNTLTDQMLQERSGLAANVRSLDNTNRLLVATQRDLIQAEKLASIGRLAAGVAHEVGNPLGAMMGYLAVVRRRGGDAELVDGMEREARRIDQIVRGLLEYARPSSVGREPADVNASVERVVELLRKQGRLGEVEVALDLDSEIPLVAAAPHPLDQLWVNLLTNAEDAMGGKGRLVVRTRRGRWTIERPIPHRRGSDPPEANYAHIRRARGAARRDPSTLEDGDEIVRVTVEDSGPGVPQDCAELIWDPFFTTKAPGEGTGLGLAIVASTVAELRGRVGTGASEYGGACFLISLPIYHPAA